MARKQLPGEWGFSIFIEHGGLRILLDAGASDLFLKNAALRVYVQSCVLADCYAQKDSGMEYIGVAPALLEEFEKRLVRVEGDHRLAMEEQYKEASSRESPSRQKHCNWRYAP